VIRIDKPAVRYLLLELLRGMATTLRYMFKRKGTLNYPYEKSPECARFRGEHAHFAVRTAKSAVSPASCPWPFVRLNPI